MVKLGKNKAELTNAQKELVESMIKNEEHISSIYATITKKDGPLKEKGVFSYSESVLYKYIRNDLKKRWDKKYNKWVQAKEEETKQNATSCVLTPLVQNAIMKKVNELTEAIVTTHEKLTHLAGEISRLEKLIFEIRQDNPYEKNLTLSKDFLKIYTSRKQKKGITINKEIIDKVIKYMEKHHNISGNDSLAIDAALILSLYRSVPSEVDMSSPD